MADVPRRVRLDEAVAEGIRRERMKDLQRSDAPSTNGGQHTIGGGAGWDVRAVGGTDKEWTPAQPTAEKALLTGSPITPLEDAVIMFCFDAQVVLTTMGSPGGIHGLKVDFRRKRSNVWSTLRTREFAYEPATQTYTAGVISLSYLDFAQAGDEYQYFGYTNGWAASINKTAFLKSIQTYRHVEL